MFIHTRVCPQRRRAKRRQTHSLSPAGDPHDGGQPPKTPLSPPDGHPVTAAVGASQEDARARPCASRRHRRRQRLRGVLALARARGRARRALGRCGLGFPAHNNHLAAAEARACLAADRRLDGVTERGECLGRPHSSDHTCTLPIHKITEPAALTRSIAVHTYQATKEFPTLPPPKLGIQHNLSCFRPPATKTPHLPAPVPVPVPSLVPGSGTGRCNGSVGTATATRGATTRTRTRGFWGLKIAT